MKISSKLSELKPTDLNCNVFDVYSYDGLSMQELLCQFFTKINECIKVSNETIDLASWLVNEGLKIEVVKKLMLWLEDGTLENLINVNLFNTLHTKIENINTQLTHIENDLIYYVNVKDFGAKGDGDTNDTNAFLKALEKSNTIYFPKGTYIIQNALIDRSNVTIFGDNGNTFIKNNQNLATLHFKKEGYSENITIHDLNFIGNRDLDNQTHIKMYGGKNVSIYNCTFTNCGFSAIVNYAGLSLIDSKIFNCTFKNTGEAGINIRPFKNLSIYNNTFLDGINGIHYPPHAIYLRNDGSEENTINENIGEGAYIYDNKFIAPKSHSLLSNPHCIKVASWTGEYITNVFIYNNYFDWEAGINLIECSDSYIKNNEIKQKEMGNTNGLSCIQLNSCGDVNISNNFIAKYINNKESYCIRLVNTNGKNKNIVIENNNIFSNTLFGIRVDNEIDNLEIVKNKITVINSRENSQCSCILLDQNSKVSKLTINDNILVASHAGIKVDTTSLSDVFILNNNILYDKGTDTPARGVIGISLKNGDYTKFQGKNYICRFYTSGATEDDIKMSCIE
ncbi:MAG: hypothetical protein IJ086_04820 [Clostridium sp.]|nr:hypothetical protein [Clostridium sp.]